uniref:Uncharacterized protein n=1 Tax=Ditylenchus dipsaci TaxID=166011 RepID=A0A915EU44_9BILA
ALNIFNDLGYACIHLAMQKRDIQLVEELVKLGADINARDYSGKTCLHMALLNNIAVVAKLIDLELM